MKENVLRVISVLLLGVAILMGCNEQVQFRPLTTQPLIQQSPPQSQVPMPSASPPPTPSPPQIPPFQAPSGHIPSQQSPSSPESVFPSQPASPPSQSSHKSPASLSPSSHKSTAPPPAAIPAPQHAHQHQPQKLKRNVKVKGIYVSGWAAATKLDELIQTIETSPLNAMVIDIKTDTGRITYNSKIADVDRIGSDRAAMIKNMPELLQKLKSKDIYTIGRIVTFKDPLLAKSNNNLAILRTNGQVWHDANSSAWTDPFNRKVWNYNIEIAKEAARIGFDEIQFDYVRFPENGAKLDKEVRFNNQDNGSKAQAITEFLQTARSQLNDLGVVVSADVFGLTTSTSDDMGIGQDWNKISSSVDYISPMIYPSHYSPGNYQLSMPNSQPYELVRKALTDAKRKNMQVAQPAIIRPWLQDFTATWIKPYKKYGHAEVLSQIKAAEQLGIDEYLLWNAKCTYSI